METMERIPALQRPPLASWRPPPPSLSLSLFSSRVLPLPHFHFSISLGLVRGHTDSYHRLASTRKSVISYCGSHIFCNVMGLPTLSSSRTKGAATVACVAGLAGFCWLLFPASSPDLYNNRRDGCSCWHGYCSWN